MRAYELLVLLTSPIQCVNTVNNWYTNSGWCWERSSVQYDYIHYKYYGSQPFSIYAYTPTWECTAHRTEAIFWFRCGTDNEGGMLVTSENMCNSIWREIYWIKCHWQQSLFTQINIIHSGLLIQIMRRCWVITNHLALSHERISNRMAILPAKSLVFWNVSLTMNCWWCL